MASRSFTQTPAASKQDLPSTILTISGKNFDFIDPKTEQIDIEDIAHALSHNCRYNGHTKTFYSVAEHCVRVSYRVPHEDALWGLLHDAADVYLSDIPSPIKQHMSEYQVMEHNILLAIALKFDLSPEIPHTVHLADELLLATEARDLCHANARHWNLEAEPLYERIRPLGFNNHYIKAEFLKRFYDLTGAPQ